MQSLLDLFNQLFGAYEPIQCESVIDQSGQVFTYEYLTNWGTIAHYVFIGIVLYCVCCTIGKTISKIGGSVGV